MLNHSFNNSSVQSSAPSTLPYEHVDLPVVRILLEDNKKRVSWATVILTHATLQSPAMPQLICNVYTPK